MPDKTKGFARLWIAFLAVTLTTSGLEAQYFGRNKVQYEKFDFRIIKTKHFDVYYYPEFKSVAEDSARMAERWYARLSRMLGHELKGRQPLIMYSSSPHFQQTTVLSGLIGEGTGGVTESLKRRIILPVGSSPYETDHVIGHELVHAFQYDLTSEGGPSGGAGGGMSPALARVPLWFIEGLAEYLSIGAVDPHTAMWMRDATRRNFLPTLKKMEDPYKYFPYRYGQAFWAYVTGRWGDETVSRLMKSMGRVGDLDAVAAKILGVSAEQLGKDWQEAYKKAFDPVLQQTELSDPASRMVLKGKEDNPYNVSPVISPDGKNLMFLSTRDLFSIDLYLADARSGKVKKKITQTAVDPEFESIQFIRSAGAWDPKGKTFVFGAISKGQPILTFFDLDKEKITDEVEFKNLDEIFSPTWSPDGRSIAFSAMTGGKSDLFIYDLGTKTPRQITDDFFADLHPSWSPDGRSIAFVTDRFTTDLTLLSIGDYELALVDPLSGKMERVPAFSAAKNTNPQWTPDSKSLVFLSDQSGKTDIYRIDLETKKYYQITNLYTGVSGITDLSPAISVAEATGQLAYSGYDDGYYTIYVMDSPDALQGDSRIPDFGGKLLSVLPPREQPGGALLGLLRNPLFGLPEQVEFPESSYKPKLTLDYVAPPQIGVGVDRFGTYSGGGVGLFWGDMLGYHSLGTIVQSSSRLKDLTGIVSYQNSQRRLNWGGVAGRIPYVYGGYNVYWDPENQAYIEDELLYWQINYQLSGYLAYPISQVQRVEMYAGYQFIDFDNERITQAYTFDGYPLYRDVTKLPSPESISYVYTTLALVYDSALFGATAPILGQSYLLEAMPTYGNYNMYTIMADYRKYLMPVRPFTIAFRALHYGRYGRDSEDQRMYPLYIGYESLVRGYDYYSYSFDSGGGSADFTQSRLYGSKMLVANAELRFPLFGVLGIGKGYYGVFPIDMYLFYDWGVAWYGDYGGQNNKPTFLGGNREPVSSAGIGMRVNVFGYLVVGVNLVKPFDRPDKGWYFQLSFWPGF
jgi:Peptidase of plants and bacteria/WD40-like Beta Propeller Repeat